MRYRPSIALAGLWLLAGVPHAVAAAPLGLSCAPAQEVVRCDGLVNTWDGVPLDTTVVLPEQGATGLPLVAEIHGFGNSKHEYLDPASTAYTDNAYAWAKDGYAVLTYTARGLWGSCGMPEARLANPLPCASGYLHLADARYEVRDAQELIGRLVDAGVADAGRIGVTGDSYGGGQSFMFAALRDRVMLPDGSLTPWQSPAGTPLTLAAAAPVIPWTDLIGAAAPNGRTRAYEPTPAGDEASPVGVFKQSFANAILVAAQNATGPGQPVGEPFIPGRPMGFVAPPGVDSEADVAGWVTRSNLGEPYTDAGAQQIVSMLRRFHSAYGIDSSSAPPPLFVGAGFSDDLFPVDETLRYVNRLGVQHPDVPVSLLFGDYGHQRASNKPAVRDQLLSDIHTWFDHYVRGDGPAPPTGVTASTQSCPRDAPAEGPFHAPSFAGLAHGEVSFGPAASQTVGPVGGNPLTGLSLDPVAGMGDGCVEIDARDDFGTATYRLPAASGDGFTLLGAPRIMARLGISGADPSTAQVAARLWDVNGSSQRLVARGTYRPSGQTTDTWELHANGWHFAPGHVAKLELLSSDAPYARASNAVFSIAVQDLELHLPTLEGLPETVGGAVPALDPPCLQQLSFKIKTPRRLRSARVTVDGRAVSVRGRRATIDLRGYAAGIVRVKITGRKASGKRYKKVRRYRVCGPA